MRRRLQNGLGVRMLYISACSDIGTVARMTTRENRKMKIGLLARATWDHAFAGTNCCSPATNVAAVAGLPWSGGCGALGTRRLRRAWHKVPPSPGAWRRAGDIAQRCHL
jgi:hypothetical protein